MAYYQIEIVHQGDDGGRRVVARYALEDPVGEMMERPSSDKWLGLSPSPSLYQCPICRAAVDAPDRGAHWRWHNERNEA